MRDEVAFRLVRVPQGWTGVAWTERGLCSLVLPRASREQAASDVMRGNPDARLSQGSCGDILQRLEQYFSGERVGFPDVVDLGAAPAFRQEVWRAAREIQYGETRTYGWLAELIGRPKAPRAVGQALGANPLPLVIPCHRVLGSSGDLRGFADGLEMKSTLLALEGISRVKAAARASL